MKYNKLAIGVATAMGLFAAHSIANEVQEVETIVVTGQKIDRTLKETPTSVAVITTEDLEKQNIQNISDVFAGMANVAGDLTQGFSIRGINAFNVSGGGNSYLTTMYLDGAPLPYRVMRSGAVPVWDVSQIEVFRGPQSTLQGRNSLAGAVHIRTQDPTYEWGGKTKVTLGNIGQREFAFAGGGGLIDDMLAFRLSFEDKSLDGDIYNPTRREYSNHEESNTLRAKLLFQPTDNITTILTLANTESDLGPYWATFEYGDSPFNRETQFNSDIWSRTDTDIATLEFNWDITDELSLVSILTTNDSDYGYNWDSDLTAKQLVADNRYARNDKTDSLEIRFAYDSDKLEAVVGLYASDLEVSDYASGERAIFLEDVVGAGFTTAVTGLLMQNGFDQATASSLAQQVSPLYPNIDPIYLAISSSLGQEVTSRAIFADIKYSLNDSFDLLAGIRYEEEEQENKSDSLYRITNPMPNPTAYPAQVGQLIGAINGFLNGFAANASGIEPPSAAEFDAFLPKFGLSYHINEDITTSLIYQKGFRSGGVGTNIARNELFTYEPEYTDNIELSYRSVWLNGNLMFNANAFFTKWEKQQVEQQLSGAQFDTITRNAGESEVKGFETEVFYYPNNNLTITAGFGYSKSEFTDFRYDDTNLTGRSFADSPKLTSNLAVEYDFDNGTYLNVNANYQDRSLAYVAHETVLGDVPAPYNDGRTLVNAQLGYDFGAFKLQLDVRNLLDEEYVSQYFRDAKLRVANEARGPRNDGQHIIGRSRQYSLTIQAEF